MSSEAWVIGVGRFGLNRWKQIFLAGGRRLRALIVLCLWPRVSVGDRDLLGAPVLRLRQRLGVVRAGPVDAAAGAQLPAPAGGRRGRLANAPPAAAAAAAAATSTAAVPAAAAARQAALHGGARRQSVEEAAATAHNDTPTTTFQSRPHPRLHGPLARRLLVCLQQEATVVCPRPAGRCSRGGSRGPHALKASQGP